VNVLQEGEISADLFTFHEAVSQLQLLEEEVLDSHAGIAEMGPRWAELDHALLAMTNDVDYDQDGKVPVTVALKISSFMALENVSDRPKTFEVGMYTHTCTYTIIFDTTGITQWIWKLFPKWTESLLCKQFLRQANLLVSESFPYEAVLILSEIFPRSGELWP
jgi:hypothetical protein